jgi:hypothetical protein
VEPPLVEVPDGKPVDDVVAGGDPPLIAGAAELVPGAAAVNIGCPVSSWPGRFTRNVCTTPPRRTPTLVICCGAPRIKLSMSCNA